jgi:hypothetical protein
MTQPVKRLAALVFGKGDAVNELMAEFAAALAGRGRRLAGVVQVSAHTQGCASPQTHVLDLESGVRTPILQDLGTQSQACRADNAALAEVAANLREALLRRPDFVFVNRFGRLESEGGGMRDEIATAVSLGIPVIIGVATQYLDVWRAFALDLGEELACDRQALDDWATRLEAADESPAVP